MAIVVFMGGHLETMTMTMMRVTTLRLRLLLPNKYVVMKNMRL
jgi:hypothetical protein